MTKKIIEHTHIHEICCLCFEASGKHVNRLVYGSKNQKRFANTCVANIPFDGRQGCLREFWVEWWKDCDWLTREDKKDLMIPYSEGSSYDDDEDDDDDADDDAPAADDPTTTKDQAMVSNIGWPIMIFYRCKPAMPIN